MFFLLLTNGFSCRSDYPNLWYHRSVIFGGGMKRKPIHAVYSDQPSGWDNWYNQRGGALALVYP